MMRTEKAYLPKASKITIKDCKKSQRTKLKLRTKRYVYTHIVDEKAKADKIMQSIPPTLKKEHVGANKK